MSDAKLHRLIPVADIAAEVAANWVQDQAIPAAATATGTGTGDPGGLYDRQSAGARGFIAFAFWETAARAVVFDASNVSLRPVVQRRIGADAALTRVTWGDTAAAAPPGTDLEFATDRPAPTWLKVTAATSPGGATAYLAIYTAEVA